MSKVKFTFILKSGKVFDTVVELNTVQFYKIVDVIRLSFRDNTSACVTLEDCVVRLSECAVVDWEVL